MARDDEEDFGNSDNEAPDDSEGESVADEGSDAEDPKADESDSAVSEASPMVAPSVSPPPPMGDKPDQNKLAEYLMAKYSKAADPTALNQAYADARSSDNVANIGRALEGLARSQSMAHGGQGVNNALYDNIAAEGRQGIQQAGANRQMNLQGFDREASIRQKIAQNMLLQGTAKQKAEAQNFLNNETMRHHKEQEDIKRQSNAALDRNTQVRLAGVKEAGALRKSQSDERLASQKEKDQDKAYPDVVNQADGTRGAPKNFTAALLTQTAIKNAEHLIAQYPNLDDMPKEQVQQLNGELTKIAQGGPGTEADRHGLDPGTFREGLSNFLSKTGNSPTGAQLGEFIQKNVNYLKGLKEVSNGVIKERRENIYMANKRRLRPEDAEEYKNKYLSEESPVEPANPKQAYEPGTAVGAPAAKVDSKIDKYAKENNLDYGAARNILTGRGYKPNE